MIRSLSYIGFVSPTADEWNSFGPEVLGAQVTDPGADGAVRLRVDDAEARIVIHPGDTDQLAYLGWDVADADGLAAAVSRIEQAGVTVHPGDTELAATRLHRRGGVVQRSVRVPARVVVRAGEGSNAFVPGRPISGFVTGAGGLGHAVLIVPDLAAADAFYGDVLGFKPSDSIDRGMTVRFFHCNPRHHTLAVAGVPGMVGVHHLMLEVGSIDDVGTGLDIVNARQLPLAMSLGRHTNDYMTLFYVRTPSGFEIEYGTGGLLIDDDTWEVGTFDAPSFWGHKPPSAGPLRPTILRRVAPADA